MTKYVPLNKHAHGRRSWIRGESYAFAARQPIIGLTAAELSSAALEMPIGFVKEGQAYRLAAILSYRSNRNLFVGPRGRWLANYIPIALRGRPFRLMQPEGRKRMVLCIDEESNLITDGPGANRFFDEEGKLAKSVRDIFSFLTRYERNRAATDIAVAALADASAIVPWTIKVDEGSSPASVKGIYRIDDTVLSALDDQVFLRLRKVRALPIAYLQMLSMHQIDKLNKLVQLQNQLKSKTAQHEKVLSDMFRIDDGSIPF